jgi:RNA polymerase sigma factor (sigma-70 family)
MVRESEQLRSEIVALLPRLRRFARALTGQQADADDIVQIAVERALVRLEQFQPGTRLDAWLLTIVRNAWLDEARARQRRAKVFADAELGERVGDGGEAVAHAKLEANEVRKAMQSLPEEQREAVALVCVEGLAYREAADVLGVPIGTLTSRLSRGREALQRMLGAERWPPTLRCARSLRPIKRCARSFRGRTPKSWMMPCRSDFSQPRAALRRKRLKSWISARAAKRGRSGRCANGARWPRAWLAAW